MADFGKSGVRLCVQLFDSALVGDNEIRARDFVRHRELHCDALTYVRFLFGMSGCGPLNLKCFVSRDDDEWAKQVCAPIFDEQRCFITKQWLSELVKGRLAQFECRMNERMYEYLERAPLFLIAKNTRGDQPPIQTAVGIQHLLPHQLDDRVQTRMPWTHDFSCQFVRVDDGQFALLPVAGHDALACCNSSR